VVSKARELVSLCFRARRDLLTLITKMTLAARKYGERLPDSADRELQRIWNDERGRHYSLMRLYAHQLSDDLDRYARARCIGQVLELASRAAFSILDRCASQSASS
jgi:hypothetical protein